MCGMKSYFSAPKRTCSLCLTIFVSRSVGMLSFESFEREQLYS